MVLKATVLAASLLFCIAIQAMALRGVSSLKRWAGGYGVLFLPLNLLPVASDLR